MIMLSIRKNFNFMWILILLASAGVSQSVFAAAGAMPTTDLTGTTLGMLALAVFVVAYTLIIS